MDRDDCYIDNVVRMSEDPGNVENELDGLSDSGTDEPVDGAIAFAREHFNWGDGRKITIVVTDEPLTEDSATELTALAEAEVSAERGIEVQSVAKPNDGFDRVADVLDANEFYDIKNNFNDILGDIAKKTETRRTGDSTCVAPGLGDDQGGDSGTTSGNEMACKPSYAFGELEGSEGRGLDRDIVLRYPVTIWHSKDLQTPAELRIRLRDGGLERLAGAINSVVRQGNEQNRQIERRVRISNEQELYTGMKGIERPTKTTYQLVNADTGSTSVSVTTDLEIGVQGSTVFEDDDGEPSTIDFSNAENQFTAHKGSAIQVIVNNGDGVPDIDPLAVQCAETDCGEQQIELGPNILGNETGEEGNESTGGVAYASDTLEIGETSESEEAAACSSAPGDDSCVVLRAGRVSDTILAPGTHLLRIAYDPASDAVTVEE